MRLFRLNIEVRDLDEATAFYSTLLGQEGRLQAGRRCYFTTGEVTLQVVQTAAPQLLPKALYFVVDDLASVHGRARELGCLSGDMVHGAPAAEPAVRPWGEKSFYADDPSGNPLCFVEAGTIYAG
ncbi:VOC family protein [Phenylobacterium sp.]|uniref:VOC family protein n=1 Tax=Phenylobacterium sp. TaxID=1871053 RepID=UPI0035627119